MNVRILPLVLIGFAALGHAAGTVPQAVVGPGAYEPLDAPDPKAAKVRVPPFRLDVTAVTNAQFSAFVATHAEWRRDRVPRLFADERYLSHWEAPDAFGGAVEAEAPVTNVSWFAAEAYCDARAARLPTTAEWEVAAGADEKRKDATADPLFRKRVLDWYAEPPEAPRRVGLGPANAWGVRDLLGLVWEWVADFQTVLGAGDARNDQNADRLRICGAGGLAGGEKTDYAAFMRLAMRASLEGRSTVGSMGFRCACDMRDREHSMRGAP